MGSPAVSRIVRAMEFGLKDPIAYIGNIISVRHLLDETLALDLSSSPSSTSWITTHRQAILGDQSATEASSPKNEEAKNKEELGLTPPNL